MIIGKKKPSFIANLVLGISVVLGIAVLVMIFGASMGIWEPIDGFRYSRTYNNLFGYIVVGLSVLCFIYLLSKKYLSGKKRALLSLAIGLAILAPMINSMMSEKISYPPIHDITTDTENPPQFLALVGKRDNAPNSLEYGGPEIASQQIAAFPDIKPILSSLSPDEAYAKALSVGEAMGWEISGADNEALRFEGTARTPFFKFIDDTVVVVTPNPSGSRIDVRSVSRIGRGDIGVNAKRIREFIELFGQE
jgi:uncharacterized protein (DUF1499 family)